MTPSLHLVSAVATGQDAVLSTLLQAVGLLALVRFLDVWEREPVWLVLVFAMWGGLGATVIALIVEQAILSPALSSDVQAVWGAAIEAPVTEELAKGAALVVAFLISRRMVRRHGNPEFDGPLDGMVYGAAVGLGFAAVEDLLYAASFGPNVLHLRVGFLGLLMLGHAIYSASFGAGLGLATWSRTTAGKVGFPLLGLGVAVLLHTLQDGLSQLILVRKFGFHTVAAAFRGQSLPADLVNQINSTSNDTVTAIHVIDYILVAAFFAALLYWMRYQRRVLVYELSEEVGSGLITPAEGDLISSYGKRLRWYAHLLGSGQIARLRRVRPAHQQIADLAFWKWRVQRAGGDDAMTHNRRQAIIALRRQLTPVPVGALATAPAASPSAPPPAPRPPAGEPPVAAGVPPVAPDSPTAAWSSGSPAAWYPDPRLQARLRYWDGSRWTEHTSA